MPEGERGCFCLSIPSETNLGDMVAETISEWERVGQHRIVVKSMGSGLKNLDTLLAICVKVAMLLNLSLHQFLIYKMEKIVISVAQSCYTDYIL
jgi:hypothetical protein